MTEGLIQKVFRRFDHPLYFYGYKNDIEQLEQALIAEIRKVYGNRRHGIFIMRLKDLIGDTK